MVSRSRFDPGPLEYEAQMLITQLRWTARELRNNSRKQSKSTGYLEQTKSWQLSSRTSGSPKSIPCQVEQQRLQNIPPVLKELQQECMSHKRTKFLRRNRILLYMRPKKPSDFWKWLADRHLNKYCTVKTLSMNSTYLGRWKPKSDKF
jgi:hypothetical protein